MVNNYCYSNVGCSAEVEALAIIGGVSVYLLIGAFIGYLISQIFESRDGTEWLIIFSIIFWPIAILAGGIYLVMMWILVPVWAASKDNLRDVECRVLNRIEERCSDYKVETVNTVPSFKVGDIITGTIPQTDEFGEITSYNHLYKGCKCRVLNIDEYSDEDDSIEVILIDHIDKKAHEDVIGDTFYIPARNFTKVKRSHKKKAIVNRKRIRR